MCGHQLLRRIYSRRRAYCPNSVQFLQLAIRGRKEGQISTRTKLCRSIEQSWVACTFHFLPPLPPTPLRSRPSSVGRRRIRGRPQLASFMIVMKGESRCLREMFHVCVKQSPCWDRGHRVTGTACWSQPREAHILAGSALERDAPGAKKYLWGSNYLKKRVNKPLSETPTKVLEKITKDLETKQILKRLQNQL